MASDPKFSAWYFSYCQEHNRTPSQEEVWRAAASEPVSAPSKVRARSTELHEKAGMPWSQADELALNEAGISEGYVREIVDDFPDLTRYEDGAAILDMDGLMEFARHCLIAAPEALQAAPVEAVEPVACTWTYDDDVTEAWVTGCGNMFSFTDGGPKENEFKHCCYCGGALQSTDQKGAGE